MIGTLVAGTLFLVFINWIIDLLFKGSEAVATTILDKDMLTKFDFFNMSETTALDGNRLSEFNFLHQESSDVGAGVAQIRSTFSSISNVMTYLIIIIIAVVILMAAADYILAGANGEKTESPLKIVIRIVCATLFAFLASKITSLVLREFQKIVNMIIIALGNPVEKMSSVGLKLDWFDNFENSLGSRFTLLILGVALAFSIITFAFNYAQRYVTFAVFSFIGGPCIAFSANGKTASITSDWIKGMLSQMFGIALSIILFSIGISILSTENTVIYFIFGLALIKLASDSEKVLNMLGLRTMPNKDMGAAAIAAVGTLGGGLFMAGRLGGATQHSIEKHAMKQDRIDRKIELNKNKNDGSSNYGQQTPRNADGTLDIHSTPDEKVQECIYKANEAETIAHNENYLKNHERDRSDVYQDKLNGRYYSKNEIKSGKTHDGKTISTDANDYSKISYRDAENLNVDRSIDFAEKGGCTSQEYATAQGIRDDGRKFDNNDQVKFGITKDESGNSVMVAELNTINSRSKDEQIYWNTQNSNNNLEANCKVYEVGSESKVLGRTGETNYKHKGTETGYGGKVGKKYKENGKKE